MARQQRSTTASFPQESRVPIARVAFYARVSTLNLSTIKIQKCSSPNCGNMLGAAADGDGYQVKVER
jgi:hypothetical protein